MTVPFRFRDAARLTSPTGASAATRREFRVGIESADPGVLHHHLRETALRATFAAWDYPNDFAIWSARALEDRALAERLAVLDPFHERDIEVLRERVLDALDDSDSGASSHFPVPAGEEFHFSTSLAVEFDLGLEAASLDDLVAGLARVPASSLYFHLYEARLRSSDGRDDISWWLADNGYQTASCRLSDLDVYMLALEDCRRVALELLEGVVA